MHFDLALPRLRLSASLAAVGSPGTGKWQFSLNYRFPNSNGGESSRAIFSNGAQAINAALVMLKRAGADQSPAIVQAIELWSTQISAQLR